VHITDHVISQRRLTVYHPPPRDVSENLDKEIRKPPVKIIRAGDSRTTLDEERLQRLLAGRNTASNLANPQAVTAFSGDGCLSDGKIRPTTSTYTPQKPKPSEASPPPNMTPTYHVDLNHLSDSYPLMRKVLSEVSVNRRPSKLGMS